VITSEIPDDTDPTRGQLSGSHDADDAPASPPAGKLARIRPLLSLLASLFLTIQVCLAAWVLLPAVALGWEPRVVLTESMEPGMNAGDVVLVSPPPEGRLANGTIIVFEDPHTGTQITHRIVDIETDGGYRTKGDANSTPDAAPVAEEDIVGVARLLVPAIGTPLRWVDAGRPLLVAFWFGATICALAVARRPRRKRT
jgi:signal peptidase I